MDSSYLTLLARHRMALAVLAIIGAVLAVAFALTRPTEFTASLAIGINRVHKQETQDYQYDGYYAIQASDLVSQTVVSWLQTPSILLEVYRAAGVSAEPSTLTSLRARFRTRKYSPQNIVIEFREHDRATAEKVAVSLTEVLKERLGLLNRNEKGEALFELAGTAPVIIATKPNPVLLGVLGALTGFLVGLVVLAARFAFQVSDKEEKSGEEGNTKIGWRG